MEERLIYFTAILALGITAQWLAWKFRLPSILLLLGFGFAAGHWFPQEEYLHEPTLFAIVSLSVAVILLEGGLTLQFRELREGGPSILRLISVGALVTWILSAIAARYTLGFGWNMSALIGAILVVTGPTVIGPILRSVKPKQRIGAILKWESIVIDPVGAILAVVIFQSVITAAPDAGLRDIPLQIATTFFIGGVLGFVAAKFLQFLLRHHWVPDFLQSVVILTAGALVFTISNLLKAESGLVTVTVLGVVLANQQHAKVRHIIEFKENLRVLLISSLFIILGGRITLDDLAAVWKEALLFLLALIVVVRPAAVIFCTMGSKLSGAEKIFLAFMAPRGIVAAAVSAIFALELAEGHGAEPISPAIAAEASKLVPVTYTVIVGTVAFYGLLAAPLARRLQLAVRNPQGLLIAGITDWAIESARILQELGIRVVLVDANYAATARARMQGLTAVNASIMSEYVTDELDHSGIGRMLAVTPNDHVNAMACLAFNPVFGHSNVYQLNHIDPGEKARDRLSQELTGRLLFEGTPSFSDLYKRERQGNQVKKTTLTSEFTYDAFRKENGPEALVLFALRSNGVLHIQTPDSPAPSAGDTLIFLVPARDSKSDSSPDIASA